VAAKYPNRVPVICQKAPNSELPQIKKKLLVPNEYTAAELRDVVQASLSHVGAHQKVDLLITGKMGTLVEIPRDLSMASLHEEYQNSDSFLYVTYRLGENTHTPHGGTSVNESNQARTQSTCSRNKGADGQVQPCAEVRRILAKYPDRIPVMCERAEHSNLPAIDKTKFLIPNHLTVRELVDVLFHKVEEVGCDIKADDLVLLLNGVEPSRNELVKQLYDQHQSSDGYLRLFYLVRRELPNSVEDTVNEDELPSRFLTEDEQQPSGAFSAATQEAVETADSDPQEFTTSTGGTSQDADRHGMDSSVFQGQSKIGEENIVGEAVPTLDQPPIGCGVEDAQLTVEEHQLPNGECEEEAAGQLASVRMEDPILTSDQAPGEPYDDNDPSILEPGGNILEGGATASRACQDTQTPVGNPATLDIQPETAFVETKPCQRGMAQQVSLPLDNGAICDGQAARMLAKYPDRVPVMCTKAPRSDLPIIEKKKFLVPENLLCSEFKYIIHRHVKQSAGVGIAKDQTIYLFIGGISPKSSMPLSELYRQYKAPDGFLYITYGAENTLGSV